ncbi:MAG: nSTAND1 domain-containing NTPase [Thermomicrobiales bacterium]
MSAVDAAAPAAYDVFLSYNGKDRPLVAQIYEKLRGQGLHPFMDRQALIPGGDYNVELGLHLRQSASCAVFVGEHGFGTYQAAEIAVATNRANADPTYPAFPVLLPGCPEGFRPADLPAFLALRTWVDFRRDINDPEALQRLICAIRRVPYESTQHFAVEEGVCPYQGLEAFDEESAEYYFGREADIQRLVEKLKGGRFLAVVGASGSGKSSLAKAGLIPALKNAGLSGSERWKIRLLTPGPRPLESLAHTLVGLIAPAATPVEMVGETRKLLDELRADARTLHLAAELALRGNPPTDRVVLVVDQCEEVFTLCTDEGERARFIDALVTAATEQGGRCIVILTLRADFYARCESYPALAQLLSTYQYLVGPMRDDDLRAAIITPALRVGLRFEAGLVETILADVKHQPGALPLLQYALTELWRNRDGELLALRGYEASGGVAGALAKRAETIYAGFTAEQQALTRRILLRLTQPGEGSEDTKRRAALGELAAGPAEEAAVAAVVGALTGERLLTTGGGEGPGGGATVEVAHEALIRGWERLRGWVAEDREGLRVLQQLARAAREWEEGGWREEYLYRGARLLAAVEWRNRNAGALNARERAFLEASEGQAERERRQARRRVRRTIGGLVGVLAVVSVLALVAVGKGQQAASERTNALHQRATADANANAAATAAVQAQAERNNAVTQQQIAKSRELAADAEAQLPLDPELSILLATEAVRASRTDQAEAALRRALSASHIRRTIRAPGPVFSAAYSPDGTRIVSAGADGMVRVWDAATGRQLLALHGHTGTVYSAMYSPDGKQIVTAGQDRTAKVWGAESGKELLSLRGHSGTVISAAYNPSGSLIVTASADSTAKVWNAQTGQEMRTISGQAGPMSSARFSPDGSRIITASADGTAKVWDAATGKELLTITASNTVSFAGFSPDGAEILTSSGNHEARLWDAATGKQVRVLAGHTGALLSTAYSPDGRRIVTVSDDETAKVWDEASGVELLTLGGHANTVRSGQFSPDGKRIVTASEDGTLKIWDITAATDFRQLTGDIGVADDAAFSPDGKSIATTETNAGAAHTYFVDVWDAATGARRTTMVGHTNFINTVAYSPDGSRIVTASNDTTAKVWDAASGTEILTLRGHRQNVRSAAYSPDGKWILTASDDGTAKIWDAASGKEVLTLSGHTKGLRSAAYSPDGKRIVTASLDTTARIWDATTGKSLFTLDGHSNWVLSAIFSPNGARVVTTSQDTTAKLWDAATGKEIRTLGGHQGPVWSAAFLNGGTQIIIGNGNGTMSVWDATTGTEVENLPVITTASVLRIALDSTGTQFVAVYSLGMAPEFPAITATETFRPLDQLLILARERVTRDLTPEERQRYLHDASTQGDQHGPATATAAPNTPAAPAARSSAPAAPVSTKP